MTNVARLSSDLILKYLVYSKKDRNFFSLLLLSRSAILFADIFFKTKSETKMTSKSLWLLQFGLFVWYNFNYKKLQNAKNFCQSLKVKTLGLFFAIQKYEGGMNSNDWKVRNREIINSLFTYRPSPHESEFVRKLMNSLTGYLY